MLADSSCAQTAEMNREYVHLSRLDKSCILLAEIHLASQQLVFSIVSQHSYGPEVVSTDMAEEGHGQRTDVWWTSLSLVPMSGLACPILPEGRRGSLGSTLITVDLIHSFELSLGPMCEFL